MSREEGLLFVCDDGIDILDGFNFDVHNRDVEAIDEMDNGDIVNEELTENTEVEEQNKRRRKEEEMQRRKEEDLRRRKEEEITRNTVSFRITTKNRININIDTNKCRRRDTESEEGYIFCVTAKFNIFADKYIAIIVIPILKLGYTHCTPLPSCKEDPNLFGDHPT